MQSNRLKLTHVRCAVCGADEGEPVGVGEDYEYRTSRDVFLAVRCAVCSLVYLNPRPEVSEFETIYPPDYHAFDFSPADYGFVHKVRARLEAKRLLSWCAGLPEDARILDVGCGDGFHLKLLRERGTPRWTLEGVDVDARAAQAAENADLKIHLGSVERLELPENSYDLILMIQTVEHLENPFEILTAVKNLLKPRGKFVIVTDNTDSLDFKFFKGAYWGGYHFPRHWSLFNRKSLTLLAERAGFEIFDFKTQVSPVNWVYSIHNLLVDHHAPPFLVRRFTLKSAASLSAFTALDAALQKLGRGALLRAILQKPL